MLAKRLKASDCSYFRPYFRAHPNGRQKAINLDQDKIRSLFPQIVADDPRPYPVQVNWFFSNRAPIARTQNISLSQKNWRLNSMPWVDVEVEPGDLIVCQMLASDDPPKHRVPTGVAFALVRKGEPEYDWLDTRLPAGGFISLDDGELVDAEWPSPSSIYQLIDFLTQGVVSIVEDVIAETAGATIPKLALRSIERSGSTREAAAEAEKFRSAVGLGGETLVDAYLEHKVQTGEISTYKWISRSNKFAPLDFGTYNAADLELAIEVKTTTGKHETPFFISIAELRVGRDIEVYEIWRVSGFDWTESELTGSIRRSDPAPLVKTTMDWIDTAPEGVDVPGVRVSPLVLTWTDAEAAVCHRSRVPSETWEQDITLAS